MNRPFRSKSFRSILRALVSVRMFSCNHISDVLILEQFVDSKGDVIAKQFSGLCDRQHFRVKKLVQVCLVLCVFKYSLSITSLLSESKMLALA